MKFAILVLSLAATCLQPSPLLAFPTVVDHCGRIESKYDGFNHETIITLKKMKVTCDGTKGNFKDACVSMTASLHCPGIQLDYVRYARIQLIFQSKDWDQRHPVEQRDLSVVADGETIRLGRMGLLSQSTDVMMTEVLEATVPYKTFLKIMNAQVVEMQVGKSRFELRGNNLMALRDLNNRVKP
ncbi:MAG TPA: hypothetical protein VIT88_11675 [Pyrinomonadaceae bacterium]